MAEAGARRVATAAMILMAAFVGSRVLGLGREMVIAYFFGTSPALSAYLAAFRLPDLIFQLLASGAFASAFIPVFTKYLTQGRAHDAWLITSSALNLIALASLVVAGATALLAPWLVRFLVPGFTPQGQDLTAHLTRIMLITPVFFGLSSIATAVLNARQHFLLPALAPLVYNVAIIGGAALLSGPRGIYGLAIGVAVGSMLHLFIQIPALERYGMRYAARLEIGHPGVREVGRLLLPRSLGLAAAQVNFLMYAVLASSLDAGSYAALNYAWLLMMMPLGVFGISISTAVFPTLAGQAAAEAMDALRRTLTSSLRLVLFLTIPAGLGLLLLREPLVGLLLERGQFDANSTHLTAFALLFFALGLPSHSAVEVITRGFYALHNTRTPVMLALGSMIVNVALSLVLVRPLAHGGLALSMSIAATLEAVGLYLLFRRRVGGLDERLLGDSALRVFLASGAMVVALGLLLLVFPQESSLVGRAAKVVIAGGLGVGVYLGLSALLGSEELALVRRWRR